MLKEGISVNNYDSQTLIAKTHDRFQSSSSSSLQTIFILCDKCYWCATYFDKTRIPMERDHHDNSLL
jgi:hypothetical protein